MQWNMVWKNIDLEEPREYEPCLVLIFSMDVQNPNEENDASVAIGFWTEHDEFVSAQLQYLGSKYYIPLIYQPKRSKREDSQKCEMRCSEHCREGSEG